MNKNIFLFAAATALVSFSSCSNNDENVEPQKEGLKEVTLGVGTATSGTTRAYVDLSSMSSTQTQTADIDWDNTQDKLQLYSSKDVNGQTFDFLRYKEVDGVTYKNAAYFHGYCNEADLYYVMYPEQDGAIWTSKYHLSANIPTTQEATYRSFDPDAMIQVGITKKVQNDLTMNHVCAFLYIALPANVKSVTVTDEDVNLTGDVDIYVPETGSPSATFTDGVKTVTLENVEEAGTYLIAVAPNAGCTLTTTVTYTNNKTKSRKANVSTSLTAGYVYNLGTAPDMPE